MKQKMRVVILTAMFMMLMSVSVFASTPTPNIDLTGVNFNQVFVEVTAIVQAVLPTVVGLLGIYLGIRWRTRLIKGA
jgi:hypothetical protein